jgi:anti-sigma regulatory factor (Ser/Thr protein kinase)
LHSAEKRRFGARLSEFAAVRKFVESACAVLTHAEIQRLVLIAEELFCNTIEHGYAGDSDQPVWFELSATADGCKLVYQDAAPPHDPFNSIKVPHPAGNAANLPIGGLGVFLIGQLSTLKRYERRGDRNVIELCVPRTSTCALAKTS